MKAPDRNIEVLRTGGKLAQAPRLRIRWARNPWEGSIARSAMRRFDEEKSDGN
jgi:hypothetical protein